MAQKKTHIEQINIWAFIAQTIAFQNQFGNQNYKMNRAGVYGNDETQKIAIQSSFKDWLLQAVVWDLDATIKPYHNLKYGRSGSHVWISSGINNERIALITISEGLKLLVQFESPDQIDIYANKNGE